LRQFFFEKRRSRAAAVSFLILFTAALVLICRYGFALTLRNGRTGEVYGRFPLREGQGFSVGFIHSVNKSPVTDFYEIRQGQIFVVKTVYYDFGAGVQTEVEDGQTLTYGDDGAMIVSGFDRPIEPLNYFVGTVSDHILTVNGQEYSLRELCGRSSLVTFSYEFCLWE
jgi:hypothetical protein